jgi:hypothetical protein
LDEKSPDEQCVSAAYLTVFGRPADGQELAASRQFLTKLRDESTTSVQSSADSPRGSEASEASAENELSVWASFVRSMISSNEFLFLD